MMKPRFKVWPAIAATAFAMALPVAGTWAKDKNEKSVSGMPFNVDELNLLASDYRSSGGSLTPAVEAGLKERLQQQEIVLREARRVGLDKRSEVMTRMELARKESLLRQYRAYYLAQNPVGEVELASAYEGVRQRAGNTEYRIRQIFLSTEDDAKSAIARLAAGERFDTLAAAVSKEAASRERGGDQGWLSLLQLQPPVATAVALLKKGEYTRAPVRGPNGWHVLMLEDTRPLTLPSREQLAPQLRAELANQKFAAHLQALRKQAEAK